MFSFINNIQTDVHAIQDTINTINTINTIDNKPPYRNRLKLKRQQQEEKERKHNEMKEKFSELLLLPDEKYFENFNKEDVTILLQGILNKDIDIFQTIELYSLSGHIVLSVYDDEYTKNTCNKILELYPNDVSIVYNNLETYKKEFNEINKNYDDSTLNNFYFQLKTTINGLENIQTKYILKSRVDHYYSDIDKFIAHGIVTKKIVSSSLYVRGLFDKQFPKAYFHMSDLLFFGETIKIKEMLYLSQKMCFTPSMMGHGAEVRVWKPYLIMLGELEGLNLDDTNIKHGEDYDYMMKYVHFLNSKITIYPVNLHDNFKIKLGKNNMIYTKNDKQPNNTSFYYFIEGIGDTQQNIKLVKNLKINNDLKINKDLKLNNDLKINKNLNKELNNYFDYDKYTISLYDFDYDECDEIFNIKYDEDSETIYIKRLDSYEGWRVNLILNIFDKINSKKFIIHIGPSSSNKIYRKIKLIERKAYVALTTIPSRIILPEFIYNINHLINNQTYPIEKIFITITEKYKRFTETISSEIIDKLKKFEKIEIIIITDDLGPASKYLGPLLHKYEELEDNIMVVIDDDRYYNKNLIRNFVIGYNSYPTIIFSSGYWKEYFNENYKNMDDELLNMYIFKEMNKFNNERGGLSGFFGYSIRVHKLELFIDYNLKILKIIPKSFYHDEGIILGYLKYNKENILYLNHKGCNYVEYKYELVDALCQRPDLVNREEVEIEILKITNLEKLL